MEKLQAETRKGALSGAIPPRRPEAYKGAFLSLEVDDELDGHGHLVNSFGHVNEVGFENAAMARFTEMAGNDLHFTVDGG